MSEYLDVSLEPKENSLEFRLFCQMLDEGLEDMKNGRYRPAEEVFAELEKEFEFENLSDK